MPITATSRDAPVLDRVITVILEYQGYRDGFGEFRSKREQHKVWAARQDIDVDVMTTGQGQIEAGRAVYVVRWFDHAPKASEKINLRPAIVGVQDEIGYRTVTGVHEVVGYRGRLLTIICEGTR